MAGMHVVVVDCDARGNVDSTTCAPRPPRHGDNWPCLMITYPSTHGVFEEGIREICDSRSTTTAARCTSTAPT